MVEKNEIGISLKGMKLGKKDEPHRCGYCHKVFMQSPLDVFLKPSKNYKPRTKYPAFQLCSKDCKNRLQQEGWIEFKPEERKLESP